MTKNEQHESRPKKHKILDGGRYVLRNLFQEGNGYKFRVRDTLTGKVTKVATGETNLRKAEQFAVDWIERRVDEREQPIAPGAHGFKAKYDEFLGLKNLRPVTLKCLQLDRDLYVRELGQGALVSEIDVAAVEGFLSKLAKAGKSTRTQRKHLQNVRSFFRWAVRRKYRLDDPTDGLKVVSSGGKRDVRRVTREEARRLLQECQRQVVTPFKYADGTASKRTRKPSSWLYTAMLVGFHTGLRRRSILDLQWRNVDMKARMIRLEAGQMKKARAIELPIHRELEAHLNELLATREDVKPTDLVVGQRLAGTSNLFADVATRAKLFTKDGRPMAWHDLRRSFATWYSAFVPFAALKQLLGHHDENNVTLLYPELPFDELLGLVDKLPPIMSSGKPAAREKVQA